MKTIETVRIEIDKIRLDHADVYGFKEKELKKARKEISFLDKALKYLQSECDKEAYLNKDLARLNKKLDVINDEETYKTWRRGNPDKVVSLKNPEAGYRTDMGLNKIKKQIETLEYLIK